MKNSISFEPRDSQPVLAHGSLPNSITFSRNNVSSPPSTHNVSGSRDALRGALEWSRGPKKVENLCCTLMEGKQYGEGRLLCFAKKKRLC